MPMQAIESDFSCDDGLISAQPKQSSKRAIWAAALGVAFVTALCAASVSAASGRQRSEGLQIISKSSQSTQAQQKILKIIKAIEGYTLNYDCKGAAEMYYGSKVDELFSLERSCGANKSACKDVEKKVKDVMKEVDTAWSGAEGRCPKEMPISCKVSSSCKKFPKGACIPTMCHPINVLKSKAIDMSCEDEETTMECDGHDEVSLKQNNYAEQIQIMTNALESHISHACRVEAGNYLDSRKDEVSSLEKKCKSDKSVCKDARKKMDKVLAEVNAAWSGLGPQCPQEWPVMCKISTNCKGMKYIPGFCLPKSCHPINVFMNMAEVFQCPNATLKCDHHDMMSVSDGAYEHRIQIVLDSFSRAHYITEECRADTGKYLESKKDEVISLSKKCKEAKSVCNDGRAKMQGVVNEVYDAWSGKHCPLEMPISCKISSSCKFFPATLCLPTRCHPINMLKAMAEELKCEEATIECDGHATVSVNNV